MNDHDHCSEIKVVRGSPLAVIMGLVDSRKADTLPRLASILPSDMPFSGGSYQSREELNSWPVEKSGQDHERLLSFLDTMRDTLASKHGS